MFYYALLACLCIFMAGCRKQDITIISDISSETEQADVMISREETERTIVVHVCGAVVSPGVYTLPADARIYEAVEAAGGFLDGADTQWCNQAQGLSDGEQLRIYTLEETSEMNAPAEYGTTSGMVNVNTASADALCALPGIGTAKAKAIVDHRNQNGPFSSAEDLLRVKGIGSSILERIRGLIIF